MEPYSGANQEQCGIAFFLSVNNLDIQIQRHLLEGTEMSIAAETKSIADNLLAEFTQ